MENYYKLLGVPQDADINLIRNSFRKKAKTCHPDLFQSSSEKEQKKHQKMFVRLSQAYETLSDPKKRKIFDYHLKDIITDHKQTSDQKKQRSSSFSSGIKNENKTTRFSKNSNKSNFSKNEDTLEDLICEIEKIMNQFDINLRDPLEILVEWAMNIFDELTANPEGNNKNSNSADDPKFKNKTNAGINNEQFNKIEDELEHLKKLFKSRSKYSDSNKYNNFENEIDQELLSLKKKYRI